MLLKRKNVSHAGIDDAYVIAKQDFLNPGPVTPSFGIEGNTFRAFAGLGSPSLVYLEWTKTGEGIVYTHTIKTRDDFFVLHEKLIVSLDAHFTSMAKRPLKFSELNKIIDLFIKEIVFKTGHECESKRRSLFQFANIPLDKWALLAVKKYFYGIVVSENPSMGLIQEEETYNFLQNQIFDFMTELEIPNLVFDVYSYRILRSKLEQRQRTLLRGCPRPG